MSRFVACFILLLYLTDTSTSFFFGNSCSCNRPCPPPPTCPTLMLPICPPVPRCPPPVTCCSTCCSKKNRQKRQTDELENSILNNGTFTIQDERVLQTTPEPTTQSPLEEDFDEVVRIDAKCNSEELRDIIVQNIDRVTSIAKRRIQSVAEAKLGSRFNVICARGDLSYVTNTELFCQQSVGDVTCYVFKQLSDVVRARLL